MRDGVQIEREKAEAVSRRRFAKVAVAVLGIASFAGAGLSGALAHDDDDWDDDTIFAPSGGVTGSGGSGWDDDWGFPNSVASGGSGGSGGSGWDDDWDDD